MGTGISISPEPAGTVPALTASSGWNRCALRVPWPPFSQPASRKVRNFLCPKKGTSDFATPTLRALVEAGHHIAAVYTQPPRLAGRGMKPRPSAVQVAALRLGLAVRTPVSLKDGDAQAAFKALAVDACVVVAYGLILTPAVLAAPRLGCINLHPSLLPRWRGPAPVQRAIEAGDRETGVAVIRMDEGVDSGPILYAKRLPIPGDATSGSLHESLAAEGAIAVIDRAEYFVTLVAILSECLATAPRAVML